VSAWSPESTLERSRTAYGYLARVLPPDADYAPIGASDRAVLEAEERRDMEGYVEALRALCRAARNEARRAA
jgi:hypothetical protein